MKHFFLLFLAPFLAVLAIFCVQTWFPRIYTLHHPFPSSLLLLPSNHSFLHNRSSSSSSSSSSPLQKLEATLQRSRHVIRSAAATNSSRREDSGYIPGGPIYRNPALFHRSYVEMEKRLKVFVYEEGERPVFHSGPGKSIYSTEGRFLSEMEMGGVGFRTTNSEEALLFFLPFSVSMLVHYVYVADSHDFLPIKRTVSDYVGVISSKHPYWNRSHGADHFMVSCHDWGPESSRADPFLYKNSIRALCNANTSEGFNPRKDVSLPEINLPTGYMQGLVGGPSPSKRPILAFFAGGVHGPIRPLLLQEWENKGDDEMRVGRYLNRKGESKSYYETMRRSRFCICPSGYEVASPRIVEALYTGCVPVLISHHYVPPFSDVLNWKAFSVEVRVEEISKLKEILRRISSRRYIQLQRRGVQVRRHFEVNSPPTRFDVFHMILHSIWLRRLNVRIHG